MSKDLKWICGESTGVPFLLCPVELADEWEGSQEPSNGRIVEANFRAFGPDSIATDYDRACDAASDYINLIQIGNSTALVLGEENRGATWIRSDNFIGGYILIWVMLPDEEPDYRNLVKGLPQAFFRNMEIVLRCSDKGFLLFPSTQSPHDKYLQFVEAVCSAGMYNVSFGIYEQADTKGEPETEIRIIEIRRQ